MADRIRTTIMRGGTSKAVFLDEGSLPEDADARRRLILAIFGSPDRRQVDGLGGADPLTSKLAIIGRPDPAQHGDADVVYTFGQVGISTAEVDWHSLCGNITAAVGVYAIEEGLVQPAAPVTTVRVYTTNLSRQLLVEVPVENGAPVEHGSFHVPGVPGTGAEIVIDFADTAGAATGALLPTGNSRDMLEVEGLGRIEASMVDIGNAHVFVRATDLGLTGTETPAEIDSRPELLERLEAIRGAAALRMGMIEGSASEARHQSPATPILGVVAPAASYEAGQPGKVVSEASMDLVSRLQFMQQTHKTYAGTSTVCTGVASRIEGTLVHEVARRSNRPTLRIGHPAGVIETEAVVEEGAVHRATLGRTARRIMDGIAYVRSPRPQS